jgi:2-polyprenyl-3-methyl-5-hydroxy-6-metoxy-1,4-benzoquinol methylase
MNDTFNHVYGEVDTPFYYGTKPSEELETFLATNHPQGKEALDIGCGEGRNTLLLARYGFHVHALDYSSQGIHKLEKYANSKSIHNIRYTIADARQIQLEPNFYDAIIAVTLLDHLTRDEGKKVASSLLSALKTNGFIYIEVMNIHDPAAQNKATETISETAHFIKHFFEENELAEWFSELNIHLYEEKMKYDDSHGEPHYHGVSRLIGVKKN